MDKTVYGIETDGEVIFPQSHVRCIKLRTYGFDYLYDIDSEMFSIEILLPSGSRELASFSKQLWFKSGLDPKKAHRVTIAIPEENFLNQMKSPPIYTKGCIYALKLQIGGDWILATIEDAVHKKVQLPAAEALAALPAL